MGFTLLSESQPRAKKKHHCEWCSEAILPGDKYHAYSGMCDGEFQATKMHLECHDAMLRNIKETGEYSDYYLPDFVKRGKTPAESEGEGP